MACLWASSAIAPFQIVNDQKPLISQPRLKDIAIWSLLFSTILMCPSILFVCCTLHRHFLRDPVMMPRLIVQVSGRKHIWVIKGSLRVLGCQLGSTHYTHCHLLGDFYKSGYCIFPNILMLNVNTWLFPMKINIWLIAGQPLAVHPSFIFPA